LSQRQSQRLVVLDVNHFELVLIGVLYPQNLVFADARIIEAGQVALQRRKEWYYINPEHNQ